MLEHDPNVIREKLQPICDLIFSFKPEGSSVSVGDLPELQETMAVIRGNTAEIGPQRLLPQDALLYYWHSGVQLAHGLATIGEVGLAKLNNAHLQLSNEKIPTYYNEGLSAPHLLEVLTSEKQPVLAATALSTADPTSPQFLGALEDFSTRMIEGHNFVEKMAKEGKLTEIGSGKTYNNTPGIWGFARGFYDENGEFNSQNPNRFQPDVMIPFLVYHFTAAALRTSIKNENNPEVQKLAENKDIWIKAMGDVLLLTYAANPKSKYLQDLVFLWSKPKPEGLSWFKEEFKNRFVQELQSS